MSTQWPSRMAREKGQKGQKAALNRRYLSPNGAITAESRQRRKYRPPHPSTAHLLQSICPLFTIHFSLFTFHFGLLAFGFWLWAGQSFFCFPCWLPSCTHIFLPVSIFHSPFSIFQLYIVFFLPLLSLLELRPSHRSFEQDSNVLLMAV